MSKFNNGDSVMYAYTTFNILLTELHTRLTLKQ